MEDRYDIGVDIGEDSDFAVLHLIGYKNGEICEIALYRI